MRFSLRCSRGSWELVHEPQVKEDNREEQEEERKAVEDKKSVIPDGSISRGDND